ncbi:zinc-finger-containing protein [Rouxiella sp. WC2420]|uniref:Zinc-finger-containing protein n=1 Tax=Rouxiella sp. WC2420 TaxID=3234145 RepID=A0AB39VLQ3_9GAMM
MTRKVICDYCGNDAAFVTGRKIYPHRPDLFSLQFYQCEPCKAHVGCHKDSNGVPLGRLANAELRAAKSKAHAAFDPIWKGRTMSRKNAYGWLATELGILAKDCHIGMFNIEMCERVVATCEERNES